MAGNLGIYTNYRYNVNGLWKIVLENKKGVSLNKSETPYNKLWRNELKTNEMIKMTISWLNIHYLFK